MDAITTTAFLDIETLKEVLERGYLKGIPQHILRDFTRARYRKKIFNQIVKGTYEVEVPHQFFVDKKEIDPLTHKPKQRGVIANTGKDRVVFALIMRAMFKCLSKMIHERCKSYMRGTSCSLVVEELVEATKWMEQFGRGLKYDIKKYFDSLPIADIDKQFDIATIFLKEQSPALELCRSYYHNDRFYDVNGVLQNKYMSLKQGCAVASFLADSSLYSMDAKIAKLNVYYVRYCDDMVVIGPDLEKADAIIREELASHGLSLNEKKIEEISYDKWFTFLGYSIKGSEISFSPHAVKSFQSMITDAVFKSGCKTIEAVKNKINKALYDGYLGYSWAKRYLLNVTCENDLVALDTYIRDSIRAFITKKRKIGGLGCNYSLKDGCVQRGTGKNVRANRLKIPEIEDYTTLTCMRDNMRTNEAAYEYMKLNVI